MAPRVELKYAVDEDDARRVRRFVQPFVTPDPACPPDGEQRLTSLYFDTPHGDFFDRHLARDADRFKLRVRRYGEDVPRVVYFEVKRKVGYVTEKRRARVATGPAMALLGQEARRATDGATPDRDNLDRFLWLRSLHRATPRVLVTCRRESLVGPEPDGNARVTFDREMAHQDARGVTLVGDPGRWTRTRLERGSVVLELKYSGAPPWWMAELARRLGRHRMGYSKYMAAVDVAMGPESALRGGERRV